MVSTCPLIYKSSSPLNNPSVTVPRAPITIPINVTFVFHGHFQLPSKVKVFILRFIFFKIHSMFNRDSKVHNSARSLFLLIIIMSGSLAEIRWSVCMSNYHRHLCVSFFRTDAGYCIGHLFIWSSFNFLHNYLWIIFPDQSCLVLYSFFAYLKYSLISWLIISSLSPHNLHLLFRFILSIYALVWLVLMALFCAAFRRYSVFLLRFPFLSHVCFLVWDVAY